MTIEDVAKQLKSDYQRALEGNKVVTIHLFGIRYADQLEGMPLKEIAARAEVPVTYATEIRKGMRLAKWVTIN